HRKLGENSERVLSPVPAFDPADEPGWNAEALECGRSTNTDFRIRIVQCQQEGRLGDRPDLLQRLDTAHPDPPGRITESAYQPLDDFGLVELTQGAGDPGAYEWRGVGEQRVEQVSDGAAVSQTPQCPCRLSPNLVVQICQRLHQYRECPESAEFAEDVGGPGPGGMSSCFGEKSDHRVHDYLAVAAQNVRDPRGQPDLRLSQGLHQGCDRAGILDPGERAQRDFANVGILGASGLNGFEQGRDCFGVADPSQQLGGKGALPPLLRLGEPVDVLLDQAKTIVRVEQPGGTFGRAAGLFLKNRLQRLEITESAKLVDLGFEQGPFPGGEPAHHLAVDALPL